MEREHIGVPLYDEDPTPLCGRPPCDVDSEQLLTLCIETVFGRVQVFGLLFRPDRASAESQYLPSPVGQGEHDPSAEAVVEAGAAPATLAEPRRVDLLAREAVALRRHGALVPGTGRIAHSEVAQHLLLEAAAQQVLAREPGLA